VNTIVKRDNSGNVIGNNITVGGNVTGTSVNVTGVVALVNGWTG